MTSCYVLSINDVRKTQQVVSNVENLDRFRIAPLLRDIC